MNNEAREKILVTGANGQLGYQVQKRLSKKYRLVLTDAAEMDITDKSAVDRVLSRERPDYIIHGAAYTRVDAAEENQELCRKINVEGTANLAKAATKYDSTLIYISTDYVFDGKQNTPYTEDQKPNPLSVYAQTKLDGEQAVINHAEKYYILRTAWLFGELPEGHAGTNFVETMLRLAKERDNLGVVNDQIGSPTYSGDLIDVIDQIVRRQVSGAGREENAKRQTPNALPYGTYHFSGQGECSWYDFAKEIFHQTGSGIDLRPITSAEYPQKAKRPPYSYLDKSKIESALGMKVRPWQEMLKEYLNQRVNK